VSVLVKRSGIPGVGQDAGAPLFKGSSVVTVSSQGAKFAIPCYSLVEASKGALESLARHLALELAPSGVRVNILSPGSVFTDAWKAMPDSERRLGEGRLSAAL